MRRRPVSLGFEPPSDINGVGARFHPDPLLDNTAAEGETPYRDSAVEMKAFEGQMALGLDRTTCPAIGEHRLRRATLDELRVGLGKDEDTAERGFDRRHQQRVIAPGQTLCDRATGIAASSVGDPPFAPLSGGEIAANRAAKTDRLKPGERVLCHPLQGAPTGSGRAASTASGGCACAAWAVG